MNVAGSFKARTTEASTSSRRIATIEERVCANLAATKMTDSNFLAHTLSEDCTMSGRNLIRRLNDELRGRMRNTFSRLRGHWSVNHSITWLLIVLMLVEPSVMLASSAKRLSDSGKSGATKTKERPDRQDLSLQTEVVEAAVVRHAPKFNGGARVEGSVRQLIGEDVTLEGGAVVTVGLLVPGTPTVKLNGKPNFGGTVEGMGSTQPSGYRVTLNGNVTLGHLVTRTNPVSIFPVAPPPAATGTRDVTLDKPGQSPGDFFTLRDLTLNGNVGNVEVPPGTYREFTANGSNGFIFGIAGSSQPSIYNFDRLVLSGRSELKIVGPVILTLARELTLNGAMGVAANPLWLNLNVAAGGVKLNGGSSLFGLVRAPAGEVSLEGNTLLQGSVQCDRLNLNGNSTLKGTPGALDSIAPTRAVQGQTIDVTLRGINTHWVAGQTQASFGGEVSVGGAPQGELGPVQVIDSTTAIAQVVVSSTAALAPRTVRVVTTIVPPDDVSIETLIDGFTVSVATLPGASSAIVSTLAGSAGAPGFVDGPASQARFRDLAGIAVGPDDAIYVADAGNHSIRVVTPGSAPGSAPRSAGILPASSSSSSVSTLAGNGTPGFADGQGAAARFNNPQGVAVDANRMVYVADTGNNRIRRIAPDGTVTTIAGGTAGLQDGTGAQARFNAPRSIAVDSQGNLYVADTGNSAVRLITAGNVVRTLAGDGTVGSNDSPNARFNGLAGVAVDGDSVFVYLADAGNHRIRRLDQSNTVITIAGAERGFADGAASEARFADPMGIAVDGANKLIVADSTNSLIRFVDPVSAPGSAGILPAATASSSSSSSSSSSPFPAVSTIAGTGDRGLTDGAGTVARFFTPHGVAVSRSSAIIVADTGNQVLRRILLPPVITAIEPFKAKAGDSVKIEGERFDGLSPDRNIVRFTNKTGVQSSAQVTAATQTELTVIVPADAATGPVTVTTEGGTSNAASFELINPGPVITSFTPNSGQIGSVVTIAGVALKANTGPTVVTFAGAGSMRHEALVTSATATEVKVLVPNGAVTGPIELRNALGSATSATSYTVEPGQEDFQLTVSPPVSSAVQGGSAAFVVRVTSPLATFSQLVSLSASGLPPGVTTVFEPSQITSGAQSILSVSLAGTTLPPGSFSFTISGVGMVGGSDVTRTATATLTVIAAGQTTISGRVLSTSNEPILGATVSLDSQTTTTDAAGAFLMTGVTAGASRPIKIDGRTATSPNHSFPVIVEPATIVAGQANVVPFIFFLPPIDIDAEVPVLAGQNTVAGNARVAGLQMTIPAGVNLRNVDGSPVTRVSITPLEPDRTPAPLPLNVGTNLVYTSQPGGAVTDIAIPIVYPNLAGADPGTRVDLYAFDHDTASWFIYGFGRVSNDGRSIEPEIDPATGRPFGLKNFSWHFPNVAPNGNPPDVDSCAVGTTNNPVALATGLKIETAIDISFGGARGMMIFGRTYTTDMARLGVMGRFGLGTKDTFDIRLSGSFQAGGAGRLHMPNQARGQLFNYVSTETDGTLLFTTRATITQLGDELRKLTDGSFVYRLISADVWRFNSNGQLVEMTDRNGNKTTFVYADSNLTNITDPVGRSIILQYDASNRIISATDPLGRVWRYAYDAGNRLASATDPLGNSVRYAYDSLNRLTSVTDRRGILTKQISYDFRGRVIEERFPEGGFEQFTYDVAGVTITRTTVTDSLGRTFSKRFNANGYVTEMTDALGQDSRIDRDLSTNLPISITGPCGCKEVTNQFDERGNAVAVTNRLGQTTRFEYDPIFNNITKITDVLGRVTRLAYDSHGNLTSITDALNQTVTLTYDGFGQLVAVTDPLGHATHLEFDALGNMLARVDALGNRTSIEYDQIGRPVGATDPLGRRSSVAFDELDRAISVTDVSGAVTRFEYDPNGNLIAATDALQQKTTATYDTRNRIVAIKDAIGRVGTIAYDTESQISLLTSASGRLLRSFYDQRGLLSSQTDPLGGVARFRYDNRGSLTAVVDKRGFTTTFSYDELHRPISWRDPLGRLSVIAYDAVGNVTQSVDRLGRQTRTTYDARNRVIQTAFADATVNFSYDADGRVVRIDDTQSGSIQWVYDDADRVLSETTPAGVVRYSYNGAGQVASMTAADRTPVNYGYDLAGRLNTITQGTETFTYAYDALSRIASLQRPNGIVSAFGYDAVNRLIRLTHAKGQNQPVEDLRYSYNLDDEIQSVASLATAQLLPVARTHNTADAANRITQAGDASFAFDALGQTTSRTEAQGATNYSWDARGRLTRATLPNGQTVEYGYDAAGRLSSRTAGGVTTSFLSDGIDVVLDRSSDGAEVDYLNGIGIDEKLRQSSAAAGPLYYLQDHLGSTIGLADGLGNVVERQQYEAFGLSAGSLLTRYGFTGRELDPLTRLMNYRARWYDPNQGRFLTEDPIGLAGGLNLYSYVANNPLRFLDPSGLSLKTFFQGLLQGGVEGLVAGAIAGLVFGALTTITAGTALVVLVPILTALVGAAAAVQLASEIKELLTANLCPDEKHFRWGRLIGQVVGAIGGVKLTFGLGARLGAGLRGLFSPTAEVAGTSATGTIDPINDLVASSSQISRSGRLLQLERSGGFNAVSEAFNKLAANFGQTPMTVQTPRGPVQVIDLPGGGTASLRGFSSGSRPTIQITRPGLRQIKIRF